MNAMLPTINAFWTGPKLGPLHAACLQSFLKHGYKVVLHVYDVPDDLPPGIQPQDANNLVPHTELFVNLKTGSLAPFSDLFRLEILRAGLGLYVDCDYYCLQPFPITDHLFFATRYDSFQQIVYVWNAVLMLPSDSDVLADLCSIQSNASLPPWFSYKQRTRYRIKRIMNFRHNPLALLPFDAMGPQAWRHFLGKHNILHKARDGKLICPVYFDQIGALFDPDVGIEDVISTQTLGIHLFNEELRRRGGYTIPKGSIVDQIVNKTL